MQALSDIDEVNMFKEDNTVIHFKRPQCKYDPFLTLCLGSFSVRESLLVVVGTPETKALQSMLPDILKQVGPKQYQFLKSAFGGAAAGDAKPAEEEDDDDDVPDLVGNFDSVA